LRVLTTEDKLKIVELRQAGKSWGNVSKEVGCARSTAQRIWKHQEVEPEPVNLVEQARVLKMVPNPRLMLIYFEDREGVARCVKRAENNHPPKSLVLVKKVEGENDLYRIA
jgi:hypothetical protein